MRKVLRVTNSLRYGGIEKVFELHAKYFNRKDYELVFVAMSGGGDTADLLKSLGYRVIILNTSIRIPSFSCIWALIKVFRAERPDVVHTCGAEANFHGIISARLARVPRIISEEIGLPNHSDLAKKIFKRLYRFGSKVIAISDAVRDYLVKYEVPAEKVARIYNPIDLAVRENPPAPFSTQVVISCLCRIEPIKNLSALIHLLAYLQKNYPTKSFYLWLIGDGSEREMLENLAREKNVSDSVKFWGYQKNPERILAQTNLFILPSLKEGFGLAAIEAIQCSLPVVVSSSGGMVEFIKDGENGFLFDPLSFDELVAKTTALLELPVEKRMQLVKQAKDTVQQLFSPIRYVAELNSLYFERKH